jgi:glutathione S-transferase
MMQLFYAPTSPFVRKVTVCAHELGLSEIIERLDSAAHPVKRDTRIAAFSPLAKVPAARTEDGTLLYDSRVICEYLDSQAGGGKLFPRDTTRWTALTLQSLGDGLMDAAILIRYEGVARPPELQSAEWRDAQFVKIDAALDEMNRLVETFRDEVSIGTITLGCALGFLDFRFADHPWRTGREPLAAWFEAFAARPSMQASIPKDKPAT